MRTKSVDYPTMRTPVADAVEKGETAFGILLCGSAQRRFALRQTNTEAFDAGLGIWTWRWPNRSVMHNDANIIGIPAWLCIA